MSGSPVILKAGSAGASGAAELRLRRAPTPKPNFCPNWGLDGVPPPLLYSPPIGCLFGIRFLPLLIILTAPKGNSQSHFSANAEGDFLYKANPDRVARNPHRKKFLASLT